MITNFKVSEDEKTVSWENDGQIQEMRFQYSVLANHIEYLDKVVIQSDVRESGRTNLAIYNPDGSLEVRPEMPELKHKVGGVYALWFMQGRKQQTAVLMSNEFSPYDTACTFDLETYKFSDFHPTK